MESLWDESIFPDFGRDIRRATNKFIENLVAQYGDSFEAFSNAITFVLRQVTDVLVSTPPIIILLVVGLIAYGASRRIVLSGLMVAALYVIGTFGLWDKAMQTISLMLVSIGISVLIGIPTGVLVARSDLARAIINPILDFMQTIPSFVYLIPVMMLLGLGNVPAIIATVIYAAPPLIRLTDLGIREVDSEVVEASRAFGATRWQVLKSVQIPLALPSIMQGINQTTMMALAMVVIASMIGARGVGETVLVGLQRIDPGRGLIGGLAIVILAIVFDRITQAYGARMQAHRQAGGH